MLVTAGSESVRLLTRAAWFLLCCLNQILVTAGSESVRLLTRAARFLLCCLNQILVTAGSELVRLLTRGSVPSLLSESNLSHSRE
ncbi:hypothetical protein Lwal_0349 [Legionella waltersii]|uniref:Uncharacterized protein n=1 Tax=Legionella waltersii TaxID=66969 RepID=A0A0W1ANG3_9GAMM|nr:hypothetical protein Lwal_0349 [Legionella waltersii]SNV01971.1 Uncharacterised protein [Legionella waltersii]